ncbi:MAG: HEAT repeat domain-containing protein [Ginsengibacter sp.]
MQSNNDQINQELINFLRQDELDYPAAAAKFGPAVLPILQEILKSDDENLATKAAYLVGYIKDESTPQILTDAADNKFATVRIAAAYGAQKIKSSPAAAKILKKVLEDNDAGVLKMAIKSVKDLKIADQFKVRLKKISTAHQEESIRASAQKLVKPGN